MTVLDQLRGAGLQVVADGGRLGLFGPLTDDLRELARANKLEVMADLAEESVIAFACHVCGFATANHPWPGQARCCIRCGKEERSSITETRIPV